VVPRQSNNFMYPHGLRSVPVLGLTQKPLVSGRPWLQVQKIESTVQLTAISPDVTSPNIEGQSKQSAGARRWAWRRIGIPRGLRGRSRSFAAGGKPRQNGMGTDAGQKWCLAPGRVAPGSHAKGPCKILAN